MRQNKVFSRDDVKNSWFCSYMDKYICIDNFDAKDNPKVGNMAEFYNADYTIVTVVLQGSINYIVNGINVKVKANDYFVVMPCSTLQLLESKATYFSLLIKSHIMADIYGHVNIPYSLKQNCFTFHHHHFTPENIDLLKTVYLQQKREICRPDFPLKEYNLRAFTVIYLAQLYTILADNEEIKHMPETRQYKMFLQFLDVLDDNYKEERSVQFYADKLQITSKYLSSITSIFTGEPASVVIDQYVVYRIKILLYGSNANIKEISAKLKFPTQSFFGRYFKRVAGMSPREYMNQFNKKLI